MPEIVDKDKCCGCHAWACNGRSDVKCEERLQLEYYYCNNYSLLLDIKCLFKTIIVVIKRIGAK